MEGRDRERGRKIEAIKERVKILKENGKDTGRAEGRNRRKWKKE